MSAAQLEIFLARLYTDAALRERFLAQPEAVAHDAGLAREEIAALAAIDRTGLQMAAASFARKREVHGKRHGKQQGSRHGRLHGLLGSLWRRIRRTARD
jgi:hypothetical protein